MVWTTSAVAVVASNSVFAVASFISVLLRLYARRCGRLPLRADDYFNMAAWVFSAILATTIIIAVAVAGFGTPFEALSEDEAETSLKILFLMQFWYIVAVALIKISILCFYGRLFRLASWPLSVKIMLALVVGWLISFFFATLFQTWPIDCNWVDCPPTTNYSIMYLLCSVTDILLDIVILTIPISFVRGMFLTRSQKIGVAGIFSLGIFCIIASVARMVYTAMFAQSIITWGYALNFDVTAVNFTMWSGIEANASTICANLPCYGAFFGSIRKLSLSNSPHGALPDSLQPVTAVVGGDLRHSARFSHLDSGGAVRGAASDDGMAGKTMHMQRSSGEKPDVEAWQQGPIPGFRSSRPPSLDLGGRAAFGAGDLESRGCR